MRKCSIDWCGKPHKAKGYCNGHYAQVLVRGEEPQPLQPRNKVKNGMKMCSRCGETKSVDQFGRKLHYYTEMCRPCRGIHERAKAYDITFDEAAALIADGRCDVCGDSPETTKTLHIDHDHETGVIRGALCHWCNGALGHAKDDPTRLRALADYIEAHILTAA